MTAKPSSPEIPLPRGWPSRVKSAILHVISLAEFTPAHTRGWAADSPNSRIRLKAELDRAHQEITLLREEVGIEDVRMAQLSPQPRFEPRATWPRRSPCAKPVTLVKGKPGVRLACEIAFQGKRRHLPVVALKRAARAD